MHDPIQGRENTLQALTRGLELFRALDELARATSRERDSQCNDHGQPGGDHPTGAVSARPRAPRGNLGEGPGANSRHKQKTEARFLVVARGNIDRSPG